MIVAGTAFPTASFASITADRGSTVDVVADGRAVAGLDIVGTVDTGRTDRLVSVTNNFSQPLSVTVSLDGGSTDVGSLVVDGVDDGDSATFDLGADATQGVNIEIPCDSSLDGRAVGFTVDVDGSGLDGTVERAETTVRSRCRYVTFVGESPKHIQTVDRNGDLTTFTNEKLPKGLAPYRSDLDGDGRTELAYQENNVLKLIDASNQTQTIASAPRDKAKYAVADVDGDGTPAVVYANASDNNYLYRAEYGDGVSKIGSGISARSVAGVVDFDGDGDLDVVFTDDAPTLKYADAGAGWAVTSTGVDLSSSQSVGRPADFDRDGTLRVPIFNANDQVSLADSTGSVEVLNTNYQSAASGVSLASIDWDEDGTLEIVTINEADNGYLYYMQLDGTNRRMITVEARGYEVGPV